MFILFILTTEHTSRLNLEALPPELAMLPPELAMPPPELETRTPELGNAPA
jgi:hypothetical protein